MDRTAIVKIIKTIQQSEEPNKEDFFKDKYKNFKEKYPHLYKYACNNKNIELGFLDYMLSEIEKIHNKETTQEDASAKVGQILFNKYVEPLVSKSEQNTYGTSA